MKLKHINPFISSVNDFFSMMLDAKAHKGQLGMREADVAKYEITSLIGFSGVAKGSVALSFPTATAVNIANSLLESDHTDVNRQVTDAISEMVNIVGGSAKAKFKTKSGKPIELSLPNVILGKNYVISYPSMSTWIEVPFTSDCGDFAMRVTLKFNDSEL
jgi:chemotaxis protein CheX